MQRVTPGIGVAFQSVEDEMWGKFLPALFQGDTYKIPWRVITSLLVKQAGISLPDPTQTA